jgi:deoxyadenosine/deoxycytidine kinase
MAHRQVVVCLEGTIAAGKTTVLQHLAKQKNFAVFPEQVEKWQMVPGAASAADSNLLGLFYQNQAKYAYPFQNLALLTQFENHVNPDPAPVRIIERSAHSSYHVFAALLHKNRALTTLEHDLLRLLYRQLTSLNSCRVDYYLYLDVPPVAAHLRLERRGRQEEKTGQLTIDYLQQLESNYDDFFENQEAPVLRVNGVQPTSVVLSEVMKILHDIYPFGVPSNPTTQE